MNKDNQLEFITQQRKEHAGPTDEYREGYFKCLEDMENKIQSEPEETNTLFKDDKEELINLLNEASEQIQNIYGYDTDLSERLWCKAIEIEEYAEINEKAGE